MKRVVDEREGGDGFLWKEERRIEGYIKKLDGGVARCRYIECKIEYRTYSSEGFSQNKYSVLCLM